MIYAVDLNGGIGYNGGLPWPHIESDMKWFIKNTKDKIVVMGKTTWDSIGKKLPNRVNVVLSRQDFEGPDHVMRGEAQEIINELQKLYPDKDVAIIGGSKVYQQFTLLADTIYTTLIQEVYPADTWFDCRAMLLRGYHLEETIPLPETHVSPGLIFQVWKQPKH